MVHKKKKSNKYKQNFGYWKTSSSLSKLTKIMKKRSFFFPYGYGKIWLYGKVYGFKMGKQNYLGITNKITTCAVT